MLETHLVSVILFIALKIYDYAQGSKDKSWRLGWQPHLRNEERKKNEEVEEVAREVEESENEKSGKARKK